MCDFGQLGDPQRLKLCILIKMSSIIIWNWTPKQIHEESYWKMQEYISESIEPPTNPQFLNSSGHDKWSLHNLKNIRKRNFCNIFGGNIWRFMCMSLPGILSTTVVSSQNPFQNISSKGLTHIRRTVQKLQIFEQKKSAFFPTVCRPDHVPFDLITF